MNFNEIAKNRYSCRDYNSERTVEKDKIDLILNSAALAPSACNSQPYHITVCSGNIAKDVAKCTMGMGINKFADKAPVLFVITEEDYSKTAALGAKIKGNDYRSIDIGILASYITAEATSQGLATCILGWFDDEKIRKVINTEKKVRLVITCGYANDTLRDKKRKDLENLVSFKGDI